MDTLKTTKIEHPEFRNAAYLADGRIDCEIDHSVYGWIPTTLSPDEDPSFFDYVVTHGNVAKYQPPAPPSHAEQRAAALRRVDQEHANFLRALTGDATVEERDTWKTKEEASRALVAGSATDGQQAMIAYEAEGAGIELLVLAQTVIARAEAFQSLIGLAAGLKAKAKAAITQATSEQVPIEQVAPALEQVFAEMKTAVQQKIDEWSNET